MTKHQPSSVPTAAQDAQREQRVTDFVRWGSRLTPEEREWQSTKLLPVVLGALESLADDITDAASADAGKQAAE